MDSLEQNDFGERKNIKASFVISLLSSELLQKERLSVHWNVYDIKADNKYSPYGIGNDICGDAAKSFLRFCTIITS